MNRIGFAWLTGLALLASGTLALPVQASKAVKDQNGLLVMFDEGKLFSTDGVDKAKSAMNGATFDHGLTVTIDTYHEIPANKKSGYSEDKKEQFFKDWAKDQATGDKTRGVYILICRSPGYVQILADKETRDRGFNHENETKLRDTLIKAFREAKDETDAAKATAKRDAGLQAAVEYIISDLKGTRVAGGTHVPASSHPAPARSLGIGGWICIGLCVLAGVWLVIGVIRAFSGGGGGGYGGGGGGFMTSLFGGLFGAMAGMWLYNSMFGHGGMFGGSDAYASDGYGDSGGSSDTGAGDYSGDGGSGGSFDGGGDGGFGGGGDWGGGGGDF